jgi:hypothetical protein
VQAGLFLLCVFWAASIYAVYRDARRRLDSPWAVALPVSLATALPFLGAMLWRTVRPPEFVDDVRARDLEIAFLERIKSGAERCAACGAPSRRDYLACPTCHMRLREPCEECGGPLEPDWRLCPYCEHSAAMIAPAEALPHASPILAESTE